MRYKNDLNQYCNDLITCWLRCTNLYKHSVTQCYTMLLTSTDSSEFFNSSEFSLSSLLTSTNAYSLLPYDNCEPTIGKNMS